MWVCLTFCPGVLMSPSNLETPIFLFRGYFLISLIDHPHPPLSLMPFWKSCLESDLLKWSSNFLHFSLLFFIFLFLQPFCWYPPPHFYYHELWSYLRALLFLISVPFVQHAALASELLYLLLFLWVYCRFLQCFLSLSHVSWSCIFLFLFAIFPQIK